MYREQPNNPVTPDEYLDLIARHIGLRLSIVAAKKKLRQPYDLGTKYRMRKEIQKWEKDLKEVDRLVVEMLAVLEGDQ